MSTLINSTNSSSIDSRTNLLGGIGIKEMLKRYSIVRTLNTFNIHVTFAFVFLRMPLVRTIQIYSSLSLMWCP